MERIIFPDATLLVIEALRVALPADVGVGSRVPDLGPETVGQFVTVNRGGGPRASLVVDDPQIDIEARADSPEEAHDLIQLARAVVWQMTGTVCSGVQVYVVNEFSGPGELPDPVSNQARYVQSFTISLRGMAA